MGKSFKVPLDKETGEICKQVSPWRDQSNYILVDPWDIKGKLKIHGTSFNSKSIPNILLKEESTGNVYFTTLDTLMQALKECRVEGNEIDGDWYFKKQGRVVLLYLKPLEE